jgi:hypothetical protein
MSAGMTMKLASSREIRVSEGTALARQRRSKSMPPRIQDCSYEKKLKLLRTTLVCWQKSCSPPFGQVRIFPERAASAFRPHVLCTRTSHGTGQMVTTRPAKKTPIEARNDFRRRHLTARGETARAGVPPSRSAPPQIENHWHGRRTPIAPLLNPSCCEQRCKPSFGCADTLPAKAPPPLPSTALQSNHDSWDSCYVLPVLFACSGHAVLDTRGAPVNLAVDFMHSVKDVENALNGILGETTACVCSPRWISSGDHLLSLCVAQGKHCIEVILRHAGLRLTE